MIIFSSDINVDYTCRGRNALLFFPLFSDSMCVHTLQVQVFGSCCCLCRNLGVNLDSVEVVGVPGDYNIVPVVVVQGLIGVAFDQVGSVAQVRHIVQITRSTY